MSFRVVWTKGARDQLAEAWLASTDRNGVTAAAHRIDSLLTHDPDNQGEDRPNGRRILFEPPLVVIFRVDHDNDRVIISQAGPS